MRETDDEHGITVPEIIRLLDTEYGICAERKSVYDDILVLTELGFDVQMLPTRPPSYALVGRMLEMPELKMLVDAIQSSKFITAGKSRELISKLSVFAGRHGATKLSRQVYVEDRVKTANSAVVYSTDAIHSAINGNKQITFCYFDYDGDKKKVLRHGGRKYAVSPCSLIWNDENYYLAGFDEDAGIIKNFRVDKMQSVEISDLSRSKRAMESNFNPADYTTKIFGMYGGKEELVTLAFEERLAGAIIDRFGTSVTLLRSGDKITVSIRVMVSPTFYAWVLSFGDGMRIAAPEWVRDDMLVTLDKISAAYRDDARCGGEER